MVADWQKTTPCLETRDSVDIWILLDAQRLINAGVSAETLKVVMRHSNFATTEKHYGAIRSAQAAAIEVHEKLATNEQTESLVGGNKKAQPLVRAELDLLKSLLERL